MPYPLLIVSQSDCLIEIVVAIKSQIVQIQISWLLQKQTDLDLHCLQRQGVFGISMTKVNSLIFFFSLTIDPDKWGILKIPFVKKKKKKKDMLWAYIIRHFSLMHTSNIHFQVWDGAVWAVGWWREGGMVGGAFLMNYLKSVITCT